MCYRRAGSWECAQQRVWTWSGESLWWRLHHPMAGSELDLATEAAARFLLIRLFNRISGNTPSPSSLNVILDAFVGIGDRGWRPSRPRCFSERLLPETSALPLALRLASSPSRQKSALALCVSARFFFVPPRSWPVLLHCACY